MKLRRYRIRLALALLIAFGGLASVLIGDLHPNLGLDLEGGISVTLTAASDREIEPEVLDKTVEIIRARLDEFGGLEPDISRSGANNILIQLPGLENEEEALELVGTTAQLTFRQVEEIIPPDADPTASPSPSPSASATEPAKGDEDGNKNDGKNDGNKNDAKDDAKDDPKDEPEDDEDSARPGVTEGTDESVNDKEVVYPSADDEEDGVLYRLKPAVLTGEVIEDAEAVTDTTTGEWSVTIEMNDRGSKIWADFTGDLACLRDEGDPIREQVAIVLDGKVESAAGMQPPTQGGSGVECGVGIAGGETQIDVGSQEEAKNLALVLRTGALPLTLEQSEVQKVSPTLGRDSLNAGILAGLLGLGLVMIYMVVYYRGLGLIVWAGLAVFAAILYTLMAFLGKTANFTLSLAGIAGFIVSVGVTADSYIVAFERLKDEVRSGKSLRAAVDRGMVRSFRTILVADFVTGSAAVILFFLAVGSVKGFALTLGLSTIADVLIAYYFTRSAVTLLARTKWFAEGKFIGMRDALGVES
ncbi:MAG TPA: protein translocase subunit SecD [Actinomycetota bacterium]|nr:protein translocase subunit SecD [Actinomycetota bacterium]